MKLFDTHAHLNFDEGDGWREIAQRSIDAGVTRINNIGTEPGSWEPVIETAREMPVNIIATLGIHPSHAHEIPDEDKDKVAHELEEKLKIPEVMAVGEAGLDYYRLRDTSERTGIVEGELIHSQRRWLIDSILLAQETNKSVVFHCRDAYEDFYKVVKAYWEPEMRGVVHFYIGDKEMLKKFLDLGLYIGFTGVITFPKTDQYAENVRLVPQDRIVIETDSPFVAPQTHRGQQNEPAFVSEVAKKIAELKQMSYEEVAAVTFENANKLFNLP